VEQNAGGLRKIVKYDTRPPKYMVRPSFTQAPALGVPDSSQLAGVPLTRLGVVHVDRHSFEYAGRFGLGNQYLKRERLQHPAED
jgi:hypothetical protein